MPLWSDFLEASKQNGCQKNAIALTMKQRPMYIDTLLVTTIPQEATATTITFRQMRKKN